MGVYIPFSCGRPGFSFCHRPEINVCFPKTLTTLFPATKLKSLQVFHLPYFNYIVIPYHIVDTVKNIYLKKVFEWSLNVICACFLALILNRMQILHYSKWSTRGTMEDFSVCGLISQIHHLGKGPKHLLQYVKGWNVTSITVEGQSNLIVFHYV